MYVAKLTRTSILDGASHRVFLRDHPGKNNFHGYVYADLDRWLLWGQLTRCRHCRLSVLDHAGMKCVFDSTRYEPLKNGTRVPVHRQVGVSEVAELLDRVLSPEDVVRVAKFAADDTVPRP